MIDAPTLPVRRMPVRLPVAVDATTLVGGLGLGAVVAQWLITMPSVPGFGGSPGVPLGAANLVLATGQLTGLVAGYLALVGLLLAARVPWLESSLGLDRILRLHRLLGTWTIALMLVHPPLVTIAYALASHTDPLREAWTIVSTYERVWLAAVGLALITVAGLASWRRLRARMRYEVWWLLHLGMYAGVALALLHQLSNGAAFIGHPVARALWLAGYAVAFGALAVFRIALPLVRTARYRLRVESVHREAPGTVSVVLRGTGLSRLRLAGGQFGLWRFLAGNLWWQAHPYSISGISGDLLRLTVKDVGDHSNALRRLPPGTRVLLEGPYGAFTAASRGDRPTLLVAGGVGITPVRTLLEDLPPGAAPVLLYRVHRERDVLFRTELDRLAAARGGRVEYLVGPRRRQSLPANRIRSMVPDAADRDWYVCGSPDLIRAVLSAAGVLRVPGRRLHVELFDMHAAGVPDTAGSTPPARRTRRPPQPVRSRRTGRTPVNR